MIEALDRWQGRVLDISFPLREYLGGSENSAVFATEHCEPEPHKAAIKLVQIESGQEESQLSGAEAAARFCHPGLIRLFQVGLWRRDDLCLLYLTMEYAPENLAPVLSERRLDASEMREVLLSTLDALAYIHRAGFVHGHLKPSNILAVDDQVRISCDGICWAGDAVGRSKRSIYDPPEIVCGAMTPAADVWSLAMIMVEGLTQQLPAWEGPERQLILPEDLPNPFREIALNCLRNAPELRWTTDQIADRLRRAGSNAVGMADRSVQRSSNLTRYTLPLAIVLPLLAAILIGRGLLDQRPEVHQPVPPLRKVNSGRPAFKTDPLRQVQREPEIVQDYERPSPFESLKRDRVSIGDVRRQQAEKPGSRQASRTQSAPPVRVGGITAPTDTTAANTLPLKPGEPTPQDSITPSNAGQVDPAAETGTGRAAFFSASANGGLTASGVRLNSEELMAAHPSYPLGSRVRVTNLANGRTVEVRIVDRFPGSSKRIINLSAAAARELDFIRAGTAVVRIELVR